MKSISLEKFYQRINKKIQLIGAYLEEPAYDFVIKSCRLKPLSIFIGASSKSKLEPVWLDEFGNAIVIEDKNISLQLDYFKAPLLSTDLYRNRSFILPLQDNELMVYIKQSNYVLVAILSSQGYWRARMIKNEEMTICSPLLIGLEFLKFISRNQDCNEIKEFLPEQFLVPKHLTEVFFSNHLDIRNILFNE